MEEVWETSDPEELYVLDTVIGYGLELLQFSQILSNF
jgi:hypothetical protein